MSLCSIDSVFVCRRRGRVVASAGTIAAAVSRARTGLYIVGDDGTLGASSTWAPVLAALGGAGAVGGFVPLTSVRRVNGRMAMVRNAEDFDGLCSRDEYARAQAKEAKE